MITLYQVSNYGRVYSLVTGIIRKPQLNRDGYLEVNLCKDGKRKWFKVSRLVAIAFIPNPENKPEVNHIHGCKFSNHVSNLVWATKSENIQHAYDTGLNKQAQGEDNHEAKLTNADAIYIRENPDNLSLEELAKMFDVTKTTISDIQTGRHYKQAGGTIREKQQGGRPRIPDEQRAEIRRLYATGQYTQQQLAEMFGCSQVAISKIIHEND